MNYKEDSFLIRTYTKAELAHLYNPHVCLKVALQILRRWIIYNLPLLHELEQEGYRARNRLLRRNKWQLSYTFGRTVVTYCHFIQSSFTHFRKEVPLHRQTIIKIKMKHFTIFQGFYYAIAEMTEEEIVSTIGSFTYREKSKKYAASLQSKEKRLPMRRKRIAGNRLLRQLPRKAYQSEPRQISGTHRDRHRPSQQRRIGTHPPYHQEMRLHPHRLYQPQRDGRENHSTRMPSG